MKYFHSETEIKLGDIVVHMASGVNGVVLDISESRLDLNVSTDFGISHRVEVLEVRLVDDNSKPRTQYIGLGGQISDE